MKPVFSTFKHDPPATYGDCHRACLASLLEMDVPHFFEDGYDPDTAVQVVRDWLKSRGLYDISFFFNWPLPELLLMAKHLNPGLHYMLTGTSGKTVPHSVICLDDKIVHDPTGTGIVGPCKSGYYWLTYIGKFL